MATEQADLPPEFPAIVVTIEDIGDAGTLTLEELLLQVTVDKPVILPKPAATYLEEARDAGEA